MSLPVSKLPRKALLPTSCSWQLPAGTMHVPGAGAPVQVWVESLLICRLASCFGQFARPLSACQKDKCLFPPERRAANEVRSEVHSSTARARTERHLRGRAGARHGCSGSRATGWCTGRGWQLLHTCKPKCPSFGWHEPAPGAILGCAAPT